MTPKIINYKADSAGVLLTFDQPFALHPGTGGMACKKWWLSWDKLSELIAAGLKV